MLGTILVGGADHFNGRDQVPATPGIEDSDLVLGKIGKGCFHPRFGDKSGRQELPQLLDDYHRPTAVESFP